MEKSIKHVALNLSLHVAPPLQTQCSLVKKVVSARKAQFSITVPVLHLKHVLAHYIIKILSLEVKFGEIAIYGLLI